MPLFSTAPQLTSSSTPSQPELGFLSYTVCVGFEALPLYANRHLCVTDRSPPPPAAAKNGSYWQKACWAARGTLFAPRDRRCVPSRGAFLLGHAVTLVFAGSGETGV